MAFYLAIQSKHHWEEIVKQEFNDQQLIIARNIAHRLEEHFSFLKHYLLLASQKPFDIKALLARLKEFGVEKIEIIPLPPEGVEETPVITSTYQPHPTKMPKKWNVDIKLPVNGKLLICSVDVIWLCSQFTEGIKSGKTGYAWIIDKSSHFLAHYERDFVGANAFEVRGKRAPLISFTRINKLQKKYLLAGKEGVSWYVSGWHRERKGLIKKLIAYIPIYYAGRDNPDKFWSVAVVAPIDEITMMIHGAILRQWMIVGFIIICLGLAAGTSYFMAFQWSKALKNGLEREKALARTDSLTQIANRRAFYELASIEINRAHRYKRPFTIVSMDLDNFKIVNDRFGHKTGDTLLYSVAKTIQKNIRTTDVVARLGGDEFTVLLPETGAESARVVAYKLQKELLDTMQTNEWPVTFSMGVVTFNSAPATVDEMLKKADTLMYSAKQSGKNIIKQEVD